MTQKELQARSLQADIEELKRALARVREVPVAAVGSGRRPSQAAAHVATAEGAAAAAAGLPMPRLDVKHSLVLDPADATHLLTLELPAPIDSVQLQARREARESDRAGSALDLPPPSSNAGVCRG